MQVVLYVSPAHATENLMVRWYSYVAHSFVKEKTSKQLVLVWDLKRNFKGKNFTQSVNNRECDDEIDPLRDTGKWDYSKSAGHTVLYTQGMLILCIVVSRIQNSVINASSVTFVE